MVSFFVPQGLYAKYSWTKQGGHSLLEFSGLLSMYYNFRFYNSTDPDYTDLPYYQKERKKNRIVIDDASFQFKARYKNILTAELQANLGKWVMDEFADGADGKPEDIMNMGHILTDANIEIKTIMDIKIGYQKIPFSRQSLFQHKKSPFWQRPDMISDAMGRRDLGLTLSKTFWRSKIHIMGGMYNGMGNLTKNVNDDGTPDFTARINFDFPSVFEDEPIDTLRSPVPIISLGGNIRYQEKWSTSEYLYDKPDDYLLALEGEKVQWGVDLSGVFMGFSFFTEMLITHWLPRIPQEGDNDIGSFLSLRELSYPETGKTTFLSKGLIAQIAYYLRPIRSVFAVRYDGFNESDLVWGDTRHTVYYAYSFLYDENSWTKVIRVHFCQRFPTQLEKKHNPDNAVPWKEHEIRAGIQFQF